MYCNTESPNVKHCERCGAEFESFSNKRIYCTDCLVAKGRHVVMRACAVCGCGVEVVLSMESKRKRDSAILCRQCRKARNTKASKFLCAECGRPFERRGKRGRMPIYCQDCRRHLNNTRNLTGVCSKCGGKCTRNAAQCKQCSLQLGARVRLVQKQCRICGKMFQPKSSAHQYCGELCAKIGGKRSRQERAGDRNWFTCLYCGEPYKAKNKNRDKFCCREHYFLWLQQNPVQGCQLPPSPTPTCEICGSPAKSKTAKICGSEQCKRERYVLLAESRSQRDRSPRPCKECGQVFTPEYGNKRRHFCNGKCLAKHVGRIGKAARRARIRNAQTVESVNPFMVFKRDGWRCKLCGCKAPKRLRGTADDRAPELDHVVPLALGGEHSYANTQCLCRKCNQAKGATVAGQMPLL